MDPSADPPRMPRPTRGRRRHDQTYKRLFNAEAALAALVRDFAASAWVHELDLSTLDPFPTETVSPDLQRRLCDCAWRVRLNDGRWVVFLFEFQSSTNPAMVLKTLRYSEAAHAALHEHERQRNPDGSMPLVLSFVVYAGASPWTAETTLAGLARRRAHPAALARSLAGFATAHGHKVLDLRSALAQDLLPEDSVLHWVAALEQDPWTNFPAVHRNMARQWGGSKHLAERQAFADWTDERMRAADVPEDIRHDMRQQIIQPREEDQMGQTYAEWAEGHRRRGLEQGRKQGRKQGLRRGIERGRAEGRAMLLRQARRRFGASAAQRLEEHVRSMGAEQLARIGDAVVECDTADELLAVAGDGAKRNT